MSVRVSIPANPPPTLITLAEFREYPHGTVARLTESGGTSYRFVKGTSKDVFGFAKDTFFDIAGKGWENTKVEVVPNASITITFSE